jgi:hypothetical protein
VRIFEGQEKTMHRIITEVRDEARLWSRAGAMGTKTLAEGLVNE